MHDACTCNLDQWLPNQTKPNHTNTSAVYFQPSHVSPFSHPPRPNALDDFRLDETQMGIVSEDSILATTFTTANLAPFNCDHLNKSSSGQHQMRSSSSSSSLKVIPFGGLSDYDEEEDEEDDDDDEESELMGPDDDSSSSLARPMRFHTHQQQQPPAPLATLEFAGDENHDRPARKVSCSSSPRSLASPRSPQTLSTASYHHQLPRSASRDDSQVGRLVSPLGGLNGDPSNASAQQQQQSHNNSDPTNSKKQSDESSSNKNHSLGHELAHRQQQVFGARLARLDRTSNQTNPNLRLPTNHDTSHAVQQDSYRPLDEIDRDQHHHNLSHAHAHHHHHHHHQLPHPHPLETSNGNGSLPPFCTL